MSNRIKKYFLGIIVLLAANLSALDLTVIGGLGNFSFDNSLENAISTGTGDFEGNFHLLGLINIKDQVTDTFGYTATFERDPMLRNVLSCEMTINTGLLNVSVGPLFSLFNSRDTFIRPGVSTSMGVEFPGILFINFSGGATFGSSKDNNYSLETSCIALGFWLSNLLNTISISSRKFNETGTFLIQDELFRAAYRADIHAKNVPYTVSFEMGYQSIKRSYENSGEDMISSVFLGFETNINITSNITFILGAETPVFVWGKDKLERAQNHWFFRAYTGFTWRIEKQKELYTPLENIAE